MYQRFAEWVLVLRWPILMIMLMITLITGGAALRVQIDPSMESLFSKNSEEYRFYQEFRDKYGSDQMICIAMAAGDIFTPSNLDLLKKITLELDHFPQVERVMSLANAMDLRHKFLGVKVEPVLGSENLSLEDIQTLKENVLSNELFSGNLISQDGKTASLLIYLRAADSSKLSHGELIERLQALLRHYESGDVRFYMAGSPIEQYEFIRLIRRDQFTFVPLITVLLILTALLVYRSFACMIFSMCMVFMTVLWVIGSMVLFGGQMNLMTSLLAPVIMIIAVANSIHLINLFFEVRPHHPSLRMAVIITVGELGVPCFLAHFTTVIGFLSLAVNPVPAIRSFGIYAALGTAYSFIIEMLLTPILLPILPYKRIRDPYGEHNFFNKVLIYFLERLDFRNKWRILFLLFAVLAFSVDGMSRLLVDTNIVKQMKPDLPLAIATRFIDDHLTGVYSLGFVLRRKDGEPMTDFDTLQKVDEFKAYLEDKPEITKVNSITTVLKKIHSAREDDAKEYRIPDDPKTLKQYFKGMYESSDPELWKLISRDYREIRLDARMKAVGTLEGTQVEEAARLYMEKMMGKDFEYRQTGNVVILGRMAKELVKQQMQSFGFAFLSITVLNILIFKSLKMGILSSIPTLFPIVSVYGLMGYLKIELSSTTAMISSIVLGMIVDSSIHFMHRFKMEFDIRRHYVQALHHTFRNVGQALVVSTFILVTGFSSSLLANFKPTIYFGVLTALTIFLSLIFTLSVLPVILSILKPFGGQRLFK